MNRTVVNKGLKVEKYERTFIMVILFVACFSPFNNVYAKIIYVDNTLSNDCTAGNYSIANRDCSGSDGNAYMKVQDAIYAMEIGDTVYLRGGRYHEEGNPYPFSMIDLPNSLNGDSWEEGHYNTLASYPGEWAILDGEGRAPSGVVLGHKLMSTGHTRYWKIERLEITGGCSPGDDNGGGAGFWFAGGPLILRYCYIHDNFDDSYLNNPSGVTTYRLGNSIIEYNYFYHNGWTGTNGDQLIMYTDYDDEAHGNTDLLDINEAVRKNIIRYNIFDGGPGGSEVGLKYKGSQMLTDTNKSYMTYKEYGDKIHHNIFMRHNSSAVMLRQDFIQFYNNICVGPHAHISLGQYHTWRRWYAYIYNNTVINSGFRGWWEDNGHRFEFNEHQYNNIYAFFNSNHDSWHYVLQWLTSSSVDTSGWVAEEICDRNYIYAPTISNYHYGVPFRVGDDVLHDLDSHFGYFTTQEYNKENSVMNYEKESSEEADPIFVGESGANAYITRPSHIVYEQLTIATAGINTPHAYLESVNIPGYIGATNPSDHAWVRGILKDVTNVDWLKTQTGTPSWIEGYGDVNRDGQVNISDVQLVVNVVLGTATNSRADVNGDGSVNIQDVQAVVNVIEG